MKNVGILNNPKKKKNFIVTKNETKILLYQQSAIQSAESIVTRIKDTISNFIIFTKIICCTFYQFEELLVILTVANFGQVWFRKILEYYSN